jgi:hypothetical protein
MCEQLEKEPGVRRAVVFRAILRPPVRRSQFLQSRRREVPIARFDMAIMIETESLAAAEAVKGSATFAALERRVRETAHAVHTMLATNVKRMGAVDTAHGGVFLINYFFADRGDQNLAVWEYTAGWFQDQTGLDNSCVLQPVRPSSYPYTLVNFCRWDHLRDVLPSLLFKRSFRDYVLDNFELNQTAPMPILYRVA